MTNPARLPDVNRHSGLLCFLRPRQTLLIYDAADEEVGVIVFIL